MIKSSKTLSEFVMAKNREEGSSYADAGVTEMILGVQSGDAESFEGLKRKYAPLMLGVVSSFAAGEISTSELEREAESALLKSAVRYDTSQSKVAFGLYAKICIKNALISYLRKEQTKLRRQQRALETVQSKKSTRARFSYASEGRDTEKTVERISGVLSCYEKKVFSEYMSGRSVREIAADLGRSVKSVNNAMYRIKEKVKAGEAEIK